MATSVEEYLQKQKKKEAAEAIRRKQRADAIRSACHCFSSDEGKEFLRWLIRETGYHKPSVIYNAEDGEIKINATVYNEAKRDLYLRVRGLLASRPDILAEVENDIKGESNE